MNTITNTITNTIKNMQYIFCDECSTYNKIYYSNKNKSYLCHDCYMQLDCNTTYIFIDICKLKKYIYDNQHISKKIIIKYLIIKGCSDDVVYNKNTINNILNIYR